MHWTPDQVVCVPALVGVNGLVLASEQAPGLLKEHRKFGMKCRQQGVKHQTGGACMQISEYTMSASKFWMQSADWWT